MISKRQIYNMFRRWREAGLVSPAANAEERRRLVEAFQESFAFMDEAALSYVGERLAGSPVWPTLADIREAALEFRRKDTRYYYVNYFADCRRDLTGAEESYDRFMQRMAQRLAPKQPEAWLRHNQFTLQFYGRTVQTCLNCSGKCPQHGHRYELKMKKGSRLVVPYGSLELCPKYREQEGQQEKQYAAVLKKLLAQKQNSAPRSLPHQPLEKAAAQAMQGTLF